MGYLSEYSFRLPSDRMKQRFKKKSLPHYCPVDPANNNAPPESLPRDGKLALTAPRSNEVKGITRNSTNGLYLAVTVKDSKQP